MDNHAATPPPESESDDFQELMHRFLMATMRLELADEALQMRAHKDYGPVSAVVEEVTEALTQIRRDFERWGMKERPTTKAKEVQS